MTYNCKKVVGSASMAQITLYLDPQTHQLLDQASRASGMSKSRWLI